MLVRMKVQLIHQKSIWGSRTWLCMAPVRHLVSLGEASKEHQLWDIVGFMLTRVWSPQDLWRGGAVEGKVRKLGREFLCAADAECVCLQRTQDWKSLMWKVVGF